MSDDDELHGTARIAEALTRRYPALPFGGDPWGWALDGGSGSGITVAVVDSGVDGSHPDVGGVARSVVVVRDGKDASVEPDDAGDLAGHGTACAAIIRSLAPEVEIVSVRVLDGELRGYGRVFAEGLDWAVEQGYQVVNLSLSTANDAWYAAFHEIADAAYFGGTTLVSALNNVPRPSFPSEYASVVSVASLPPGAEGVLAYNPTGLAEFGAPGIDVRVAWLEHGHATVTGNSFAAPYVAGLVAAMRSKHPWLTPFQVKAVLQAMAVNAAPAVEGHRDGAVSAP